MVCAQKDQLIVRVNKLSSTKNLLPYDYYSLPFCKPAQVKSTSENLGEVLRGDRILTSLYEVGRPPCFVATALVSGMADSFLLGWMVCRSIWIMMNSVSLHVGSRP